MKRSLTRAALGPNRLRLAGAIRVITCVIGVNAVSALSRHFNQIAADAIADCIGGQILQSMPVPSATFKECLLERINKSKPMIRLIAGAFVLIISTSAQAAPLAPLQQPDDMITQVREACGAGMHMVNGTCMRTATRRNAARCAVGMRTVGGRCVK